MNPLKRILVAGLVTIGMVGTAALPASATHTHVRRLGNGGCAILAANGNERNVVLKGYDHLPENRRHPHHVKVHRGQPGKTGQVAVYAPGSDGCAFYVNG